MEYMITVLMSVYNEKEEWMRGSIDSILNQTYSNFEFIIINDNPKRELNKRIIKSYLDSRILYFENEENIGLAKTLNKGIKLAKGKYIARMDADDISKSTRLEKQVQYMESYEDCVVCGTRYRIIGNSLKNIDNIYTDSELIKSQLVLSSCFGHPTVMIRKEVFEQSNICYDVAYDNAEDYKLWVDLSECGGFHNIPEILLKYRKNLGGISNTKMQNQMLLSRKIRRELINEHLSGIIGESYSVPNKIYLSDLKFVRKHLVVGNVLHNKILVALYLSLSDTNFRVFIFFICSLDFLKTTHYYFFRIIKQLFFSKNEFISL